MGWEAREISLVARGVTREIIVSWGGVTGEIGETVLERKSQRE